MIQSGISLHNVADNMEIVSKMELPFQRVTSKRPRIIADRDSHAPLSTGDTLKLTKVPRQAKWRPQM